MCVRNTTFEEIQVGQVVIGEYLISQEVYGHFLAAFQDISPLHVDEGFARARGFSGKVMHGTILNGFLSHFIGVSMPGQHALLHSVALEYKAPAYLGDHVRIKATVKQRVEAMRVMVLHVDVSSANRETLLATGKVQVGFTA